MANWRSLASLVVFLVIAPCALAQTVTLAEDLKAGDCFTIRLEMTLAGEITVTKGDNKVPLKLSTKAAHAFASRVLNVAADGTADKAAIVYDKAESAITVAGNTSEHKLRPKRNLIVTQRFKDQPLVYCPTAPLTRDELELVGEHFDTLTLTGLLPGKAMAKGDTWTLKNSVAQALCNFEGLTEQKLTCRLEDFNAETATVSVSGTAAGIDLGAQVKLTIEASYRFDLAAKRLIALEWKQQDERDQGPANPASKVEVTTKLVRKFIAPPEALSDVALVSVPDGFDVPNRLTTLELRDPKGRYELIYGREWQTVGETDEHLILRLMERGDFVAQATITPWTAAEKGKHMAPEEFKELMAKTPGWEPATELQTGEVPAGEGKWAYRVAAQGKMDDVEVVQSFYLVANQNGEQIVVAFTMTPKQVERLGTRDLSLVGSLEFPKK
ncbi:MAG TPA: hypothetical protein VGG61_00555 [Gemmataceae bacterium]|jgi:hypothetical protein